MPCPYTFVEVGVADYAVDHRLLAVDDVELAGNGLARSAIIGEAGEVA